MKKFIESLRTAKNTFQVLWSNRRVRAAITITLYFFFFLFIIVSLRMRPDRPLSTQAKEDQNEVSFETMDNYEYDMTITYRSNTVTNTFTLSGTRYQEKHRLQTKDSLQPYYVKDDGIYTVINGVESLTSLNYGINLYRLNPTLFSSMIEEADLQSTIEYENGTEYCEKRDEYKERAKTTELAGYYNFATSLREISSNFEFHAERMKDTYNDI